MNSKFDTRFFERYAQITLQHVLGERYAGLRNADRPDLQDKDAGMGIEVTRAMEENKDVAKSLINEMAGRNIFHLPDKTLKEIKRYGYAYGLQEYDLVGEAEYDYWFLALPLKRILEIKVRKVAEGFYGHFNEFGLYVFSKEDLTPNEAALTMDYTIALQQGNATKYSKLYLSQIQRLYVCDLVTKQLDAYDISRKQRHFFYRKAIRPD